MTDRESQKKISQVIFSTFLPELTCGGSKLSLLEDIYSTKRLGFKQQISSRGKNLTKKLFGTAIRCINFAAEDEQFVNSPNLVSLGYILLRIAFQDEYVMKLIIQLLNHSQQNLKAMLQNYNPYNPIKITAEDLRKVFAQIILKINSLRSIFGIDEILKDYYVASETFSMFLRMVLVKLKYNYAELCLQKLASTFEIFSILCEYFDLNVIARRQKNQESSPNEPAEKSQVFLFSNYNLFISTVDNHEFCLGKYYSNETQLINSEKEIRKSTFEFILKNKIDSPKNSEKIKDQNEEKTVTRMSQIDMNFQMFGSGMLGANLSDATPFFSSTLSTPQFGMLFESKKLRKSMDSEGLMQHNLLKNLDDIDSQFQNLGIVEEEMSSPNSEMDRFFTFKESDKKNDNSSFQKYEEAFTKKFAPYQYVEKRKDKWKKEEDMQSPNKPLSPPSIEIIKRRNNESSKIVLGDSQQESTLKQIRRREESIKLKTPPELKISIQQSKHMEIKGMKNAEFNMMIKETSEKSLQMHENSIEILRITEKPKYTYKQYSIPHKFHLTQNQQASNFSQIQYHKNMQKSSSKKDTSQRKYSANEINRPDLKQCQRQKQNIHHSNYFIPQNAIQMVQSNHTTSYNTHQGQESQHHWQNRSQNSPSKKKRSLKNMQFASNIINVQVKNEKTQIKSQSKNLALNRMIGKKTYPSLESFRMKLLRNSNSSKNSRSPRGRHGDIQASRHVSEHSPKSFKRAKESQLGNEQLSRSKISEKVTKQKDRRSPRFSKVSKFPQFLRNTNNRKFMKSEHLSKEKMQKQKTEFHSRVTKLSLKQILQQQRATAQSTKLKSSKQTNLKNTKTIIPRRQNKMKTENNINVNSQMNRKKQATLNSSGSMKQIKSQPRFTPFLQNSITFNNNLLLNDLNHRPWAHTYKTSEEYIMPPFHDQLMNVEEENSTRQSLNGTQSKRLQDSVRSVTKSHFILKEHLLYNNNQAACHYSPQKQSISNSRASYINPVPIVHQLGPVAFNCPYDLHKSSRASNLIQITHPNANFRIENIEKDRNPTSVSSSIFSKTDVQTPSTLLSIENEIFMRQENYRKHIWQNAFIPKI